MQELQIGRVYRHFKGDYYLAYGNFFHRGSVSFPSTQKRRANLEWDQIRLCVCASGMIALYSTFPLWAATRKVCSHLEQNSGKFSSTVSSRI